MYSICKYLLLITYLLCQCRASSSIDIKSIQSHSSLHDPSLSNGLGSKSTCRSERAAQIPCMNPCQQRLETPGGEGSSGAFQARILTRWREGDAGFSSSSTFVLIYVFLLYRILFFFDFPNFDCRGVREISRTYFMWISGLVDSQGFRNNDDSHRLLGNRPT